MFLTPAFKSLPAFKSSPLKPQTMWNRGMLSLLYPSQIPDPESLEMGIVLYCSLWVDLLHSNSNYDSKTASKYMERGKRLTIPMPEGKSRIFVCAIVCLFRSLR